LTGGRGGWRRSGRGERSPGRPPRRARGHPPGLRV